MDDLNYVEPTPTTEGYSGDRGCYRCGTIFEKGHVLPKAPYFVGFELVSESRPNAYMVDGTDLLSRLFGPHRAYQTGDSVTYRIVMSDGGTAGFEYNKLNDDDTSFDYVVNGNPVTITFKQCNPNWVSEAISLIEEYSGRGFNLAYWQPVESGKLSCRVGYSAKWLEKIEKDHQDSIRYAGLTPLTDPEAVPSYTAGVPSKSITGTGDTDLFPFIAIMAVSCGTIVTMAAFNKKRSEYEE